jgi:hypothetical protein
MPRKLRRGISEQFELSEKRSWGLILNFLPIKFDELVEKKAFGREVYSIKF